MNALEELDAPGEWYLDRTRKQLYYYPQGDLARSEIVLATLPDALVKIHGAKHVKFVGLRLEYGHGDGLVAQDVEHVESVRLRRGQSGRRRRFARAARAVRSAAATCSISAGAASPSTAAIAAR